MTVEDLLAPYDFGNPLEVENIFKFLTKFEAVNLPWYKDVSVLSHIANVANFSIAIGKKALENGVEIDLHKIWLMAWLRDIGRVPWGIAEKEGLSEITNNYGHHGYLGYKLLIDSGVPENLAIISMTHIGSGIDASEAAEINRIKGKQIFPEIDWYPKTLEEMIIVIADKIPGWNNTVIAHYEANQRGETVDNKIYSWLANQDPLWERFWSFKERVDLACGGDVLKLFDPGLLSSTDESYSKLPKPEELSHLDF